MNFIKIHRQKNHGSGSSYMDILIKRTRYVLSGRAGPGLKLKTVGSEGERSPHLLKVADAS